MTHRAEWGRGHKLSTLLWLVSQWKCFFEDFFWCFLLWLIYKYKFCKCFLNLWDFLVFFDQFWRFFYFFNWFFLFILRFFNKNPTKISIFNIFCPLSSRSYSQSQLLDFLSSLFIYHSMSIDHFTSTIFFNFRKISYTRFWLSSCTFDSVDFSFFCSSLFTVSGEFFCRCWWLTWFLSVSN